jgi:serine kinase of HPr protein (carbohydrate metabolism regulator)
VAEAANRHATAAILGDRGVIVLGGSGAGKTILVLSLVAHCRLAGLHARLLADDQVLLETRSGRLLAHAPAALSGLAELRGIGVRPVANERRAVIDLAVSLVPLQSAPRYPEKSEFSFGEVLLPQIVLAENAVANGVHAVLSTLALPPYR